MTGYLPAEHYCWRAVAIYTPEQLKRKLEIKVKTA